MERTTYTAFQRKMKPLLDKVFRDHLPLFVTRANGEEFVILSRTEYDSLLETLYLLRSPRNAARLLKGIREYESGKCQERNLLEE